MWLPVVFLSTAILSFQSDEPVARAEQIARTAGLLDAPCSLRDGRGMPAYFRFHTAGKDYGAQVAIVLPAPFDEAVLWLQDVRTYPDWIFVTDDGSPNLHDISVDPDNTKMSVRVGNRRYDGLISQRYSPLAWTLRFKMIGGSRVRETEVDAVALKMGRCMETTIVVAEMRWKLDLFARLFGGGMKMLPALILLAIRDDLGARSLSDPTRLKAVVDMNRSARQPSGRPTRAKPAVVRLTGGATRWVSSFGRPEAKLRLEDFFRRFIETISGSHEIVGFSITMRDGTRSGSYLVGGDPGDFVYRTEIELTRKEVNLRVSARSMDTLVEPKQ